MTKRFPGGPGAGECFRAFLVATGIKQEDVAAAAGLSRNTVVNALAGRGSTETWEKIADAAAHLKGAGRASRELRELWTAIFPERPVPPAARESIRPTETSDRTPVAAGIAAAQAVRRTLGMSRRGLVRVTMAAAIGIIAAAAVSATLLSQARPVFLVDGHHTASRQQGQTFQFTARGFQPCSGLSRVVRPPTHPRTGQSENVIGMRADARGEVRFSVTAGCDMADARYQFVLMDTTTGRRSNAVEATLSSNPQCGPHLPDLSVERLTRNRGEVKLGEELEVEVVVRNIGKTAALPSTTRIRLGQVAQTNVMDEAVADVDTPEIQPGEAVTLHANVRVPDIAQPGTYTIWAILDNADKNLEWRQRNNFASSEPIIVLGGPLLAVAARPECP